MTCNYCKSTNIKYVLSDLNSAYNYCNDCKNNYNLAYKHMVIDSILKQLVEFLENTNSQSLKIEVKKEKGLILLVINDIKVCETTFINDFVNDDVYYLENVIYELTQDYYKFDLSNVDIKVCECI